jgi:cell shape-determining protein MreD
MIILLTILLTLSVLLEGTLTTLPLTLVCLICFTIFKRDTSVFPYAFFAGLFIDVFRVQPLGGTSLFYVGFLFLILLYKKKYEIYSFPFVMMATFSGSFFQLLFYGYENVILQAVISAVIASLLFGVIRFFDTTKAVRQKTKFLPFVIPTKR